MRHDCAGFRIFGGFRIFELAFLSALRSHNNAPRPPVNIGTFNVQGRGLASGIVGVGRSCGRLCELSVAGLLFTMRDAKSFGGLGGISASI